MPKVQIVSIENAPVIEGTTGTRAIFAKERDSLHMRAHELAAGTALEVEGDGADHVVYVWKGSAAAGKLRFEERASLIVENGASAKLTADAGGATILVFNLNEHSAPRSGGGRVHALPGEQVPRTIDMGGSGVAGGALHADCSCPTCEVWLHENDFYKPDYEVPVHSHTEDEIIFVRTGAMRLGNKLYGPGTALAIAADTKYGFKAGPDGLSFVNFRAASPSHVNADGSHVMDEAELWRRAVGSPSYLELA
jgi:hypothetical protein